MNRTSFAPPPRRLRDLIQAVVVFLLAATVLTRGETPATTPWFSRISPTWKNPGAGTIGLPSIREGTVRFATDDAIYEGPALQLKPTVRSAMWIPDSAEAYAFFERDHDRINYDLLADDSGVAFVGKSDRGDVGIYRTTTNRVEKTLVKAKSQIPEGSGIFERLRYPEARGDSVVFVGYGEKGQKGIYLSTKGKITRVADRTTLVPGQDKSIFQDFSYARLHVLGDVVFTGYSDLGSGIYLARGDRLTKIVDRQTKEPKSGHPYTGALLIGLDTEWAYFTSFGGTLSIGRARLDGSSVETLVDEETPIAGQTEKIGAINYASVDGGRILFEAASQGTEFNLYLWEQGSVRSLVRRGDLLGDERVVGVRSGLQAISGTRFVCLVDVEAGDAQRFNRSVFVGDLNGPVNPGIGSTRTPHGTPTASWLKLGRPPISVSAREPALPKPGADPLPK